MPKHKNSDPALQTSEWERLRGLTDDEIDHLAETDEDNPPTTVADWADAFVGSPPLKVPVNARFDADVVDWFKSHGRGYQTRMNAVLRHYMEAQRKAR